MTFDKDRIVAALKENVRSGSGGYWISSLKADAVHRALKEEFFDSFEELEKHLVFFFVAGCTITVENAATGTSFVFSWLDSGWSWPTE